MNYSIQTMVIKTKMQLSYNKPSLLKKWKNSFILLNMKCSLLIFKEIPCKIVISKELRSLKAKPV
jgi:hypothetical protein